MYILLRVIKIILHFSFPVESEEPTTTEAVPTESTNDTADSTADGESAAAPTEGAAATEDKPKNHRLEDEMDDEPEMETELEKYWRAVKDNPHDFTGWTYLLQYVEQEVGSEHTLEI